MACCAFAFFLLMRLLAPLRALGRRAGFFATPRMDAAVAWRPDAVSHARAPAAAAKTLPAGRGWRRRIIAAEAALLAMLAGPAVASPDLQAALSTPEAEPAVIALIHKNICKPLGWSN